VPLPPGAGGDEPVNFVAYKSEVTPEAWVAYTQGRSDDLIFPDLRLVRYDPAAKVIGVVESGHPAHEAVHMSITEQITLQMTNVPPSSRLVPLGSPTMLKTADGVMGRPDACWMPMDTIGDPAGPLARTPYPSLIVESAYQESWPDAMRDMQDWLGPHTGVQVVIIIKIYKPYAEADGLLTSPKLPSVRMEAAVYKRTPSGPIATTEIVQFGSGGRVWNSHPPGVTGPGQAVIQIPYNILWLSSNSSIMSGANLPWLSNSLKIDLYDVQQAVLRVS
jgi:hypothetical protein